MARHRYALTYSDKIKLISNLCDAVKVIHDSQVLHCDLKPHNIIIDDKLNVKVVDFGLAKELNASGE